MHVGHHVAGGDGYATVAGSVRVGGKVVKEDRPRLGRVVDKERGTCRLRASGLLAHELKMGEFEYAPTTPRTSSPGGVRSRCNI